MDKISIVVNNTPVNEAHSYDYLGVCLDKNLTLHEHVHNIFKRTLTGVKLLQRIRVPSLPLLHSRYIVMIQPIMMYCSTLYF